MKRDDIYAKLFALEFCEPSEKPEKEKELNEIYAITASPRRRVGRLAIVGLPFSFSSR
jgi:hypothetical protein